jgi:phosphatidylglycerophosphate synthase
MSAPTFRDYWSLRWIGGGLPATRAFSQRIGAVLAFAAQQLGLTPSQVTLLGSACFAAGAWLFATGTGTGALAGCIVLFQLGYGFDCADGQLARATGRASVFGGWLDIAADHVRNVFVVLAAGFWLLAGGLPAGIAFGSMFVLLAGHAVQEHTITTMRLSARRTPLEAPAGLGLLRNLVRIGMDTPVYLLLLPALRPWPALLALYAVAMGALYCATGVRLAFHNLRA